MGGTIAMAMNGGLYFYGFGAFFNSLLTEYGSSRAALSGVVSMSRLEHGLLGPVEGFLVDRMGPRRVMLLGVFLTGSGFIVLSWASSLVSFYAIYIGLIALGSGMGFSTPVLTTVSNWFIRKRGKALGIVLSGVGLGGLLIYPLGWVIDVYSWRTASFASGLAVWAICIPIALFMRHKPEPYGQLPDGDLQDATTTPLALETDFAASQAIRTRAFWFMSSAFALRVLVTGSVALHLRPFLLDIGFSGRTSYAALGSVALISVAGRFGLGWLGDHVNKRLMLSALFIIMSGSLWLLANTTQSWHVILFLATYAPTYGGMAVLMQSIRGDYFGRAAYGTIMGFMGMVLAVGTISGPWFAGYVHDVTGSYRFAFSAFAIVSLIALVLMLGAKPPPTPNCKET